MKMTSTNSVPVVQVYSNAFRLGKIVSTARVQITARAEEQAMMVQRHADCDWGDLSPDDKKVNNDALAHGGQLLSEYRAQSGERVWVITTADRSITTLLLPKDY